MQLDKDTVKALQEMLETLPQLKEERRARAKAPLAIRLRYRLDVAAAEAMNGGLPHENFPDLAAGSFLQLESLVEDEEARRGFKLDCYAEAIRELAGEAPEFADLADALDDLSSGRASLLLRPRRLRRQNKPPKYLDLALYVAVAFAYAAFDLHKKGGKLVSDRVMAEIFGEARTGTEAYANNLGSPWLPLCDRTWDQARFLLETGLSLIGRKQYQIFAYAEAGLQPLAELEEIARGRSILANKAAADAAWKAAGVKRSRR
jgi:hypothetical protein